MEKRKDRLQLAQEYIIDEAGRSLEGLSDMEVKTVTVLRSLYDYMQENPNATIKERREYLMKNDGVCDISAYRYIAIVETLIGGETPKGKQFAKFRVQALLDEEYASIKADDHARAKSLHLLIQDYIKTYRLDIDEGEALDINELMEHQTVIISSDPSVIGIVPTEHEREEQERLKREAGYVEDDFWEEG